jgi:hypothetical protein
MNRLGAVACLVAGSSLVSSCATGSSALSTPAFTQSTPGAITGTVKNLVGASVSNAQVVAELNGKPVSSGVTATNGTFQMNAVPPGTYVLVVNNLWTNQAGAVQRAAGSDGATSVTNHDPVTVSNGTTSTVTLID